ncbi:hypothetical protein EDC96DRAFT_546761 [Choanephora cucurbitarum]|nr:hypothetical protein EDC96DRAFT_546761 [Choanephora cucurbitarum]
MTAVILMAACIDGSKSERRLYPTLRNTRSKQVHGGKLQPHGTVLDIVMQVIAIPSLYTEISIFIDQANAYTVDRIGIMPPSPSLSTAVKSRKESLEQFFLEENWE